MSRLLSRDRSVARGESHSRRHGGSGVVNMVTPYTSAPPDPFSSSSFTLSNTELRETAYEILIASSRSSQSRPLTFERKSSGVGNSSSNGGGSNYNGTASFRMTSAAVGSRVKKALGLKKVLRKVSGGGGESDGGKKSSGVVVGEVMRAQMRVTEQADLRVRRALLRIAAGQLGKKIEAVVLPIELLQQFKSSDFANRIEYEAWQRRNLKVLEAGLLMHPYLPLEKTNDSAQKLHQIIKGGLDRPIESGKHSETMLTLRNLVMLLACRSFDGSAAATCHWADGPPLNLRLYQVLLEACFDINEETSIIEEVDEVLELIKKTWTILGINQTLHNFCFSWVLFHRYISTGQVEDDLLFASSNLLAEVEKEADIMNHPVYSAIFSSALGTMSDWAEKKLLAYHGNFNNENKELFQNAISLRVSCANILEDNISDEHSSQNRIERFIRSSLCAAFFQKMETRPVLSDLAQGISELACFEKETFSPILRKWHPLAAGVAVATLHGCYGNELKQFVSSVRELTPDAVQVLRAADTLEKDLVQIAVEDSVNSEDGGKSVIREMQPYEAEPVLANLVRSWLETRVDRLKEWVDRNLQQEVWSPEANKEHFAPSAVEVLRIVDETLEAFFLLPIPIHPILLPDLISGLDRCLQQYIVKAKSGCGSKTTYMPAMPALTRCTRASKFGVFRKREKNISQRKKFQGRAPNEENSFGITQLCVRINTLHHIRAQLEALEKRTILHLKNCESAHIDDLSNGLASRFELSAAACLEGIQQLCEASAYKLVFHDLSSLLWDGLYVGESSFLRIDPFVSELNSNLTIISEIVHDRVRTRVITDVMKASFDGFLLVLLAGGPSRTFTLQDSAVIEEDFGFLKDLFWAKGDGLPKDLIERHSTTVKNILPLLHSDTESLIERYKRVLLENYGSSEKSKLPLPPTSARWSPSEPYTLLRVLCYRNNEAATKFLKKAYNLPKKL